MTDLELEELQLQVEGGVCKLPIVEMEQLAEHVGLGGNQRNTRERVSLPCRGSFVQK